MICNIKRIHETDMHLDAVFQKVSFLRSEYPNFYAWFYKKVVSGLSDGSRKIFLAKASFSFSEICGVLVLKDTPDEKKICTLFVDGNSRMNGIGKKFFEVAFNELNTDKPLITIADNHIADFSKLLSRYHFSLEEKTPDYYTNGRTEYAFNGSLYLPKVQHYA